MLKVDKRRHATGACPRLPGNPFTLWLSGCRERKKAKVTEMEDTIAILQEGLAQLQSLQQRNYQLEVRGPF